MSQESDESFTEVDEALKWFKKWYHIPSLLVLVAFVFWTRARTWGNWIVGGEVFYRGNDAWYHLRQVEYTVRHWPETMPFEVWTNFPTGTSVSQFGTIYDQVVATAALIVGLGNPSTRTIELVHLFAPAIVGALILIPTYYLGKRLGKNRISGLVAVVIVALSTGRLQYWSMVGASDHHVAEAFTQALAALAIIVALQVADKEKPVWELFVDRDIDGLRRPVGYAVVAGVATALYMWVWPPGVVLLGILGVYVTLQAIADHLRDRSPEPVLITGSVLFVTAAILLLLPIERLDVAPVKFSILQPGLATVGGLWCAGLASASRFWDERSYPKWTYPILVVGTVFVGIAAISIIAPSVFGNLVDQITRIFGRFVGQEASAAASSVGEVSPLRNPVETLQSYYGFAHYLAAAGIVLVLVRMPIASNNRSELLFVSLWLLVVFSMTYTQARFGYYLTVPVAAMAAYLVGTALQYIGEAAEGTTTDVRPYQVMAVVTALLLITAPMMMITVRGQQHDVITRTGDDYNRPGGILGWDSSLDWMAENTPDQGNYGNAGNSVDYWGEFTSTDDYDYPDGAYGVLSWWDYGHWITTEGESIPVANPFQESASDAARFLLAQNESVAETEVLANMSETGQAETRYVVVDWQMARANSDRRLGGGGKFFAPSTFLDSKSVSDYSVEVRGVNQNGQFSSVYGSIHKQAYYETMVNRLYRYHGSAMDPQPIVTEWQEVSARTQSGDRVSVNVIPQGENASLVRYFGQQNGGLAAAREYVNNTENAQIGGVGLFPSERVPALEHYRLVQVSDRTTNPYNAMQPGLYNLLRSGAIQGRQAQQILASATAEQSPQFTKVFERVPGGTIEGEGPAGKMVQASVEMRMPNANSTFMYYQRTEIGEDGTFSMTVPYASTGADNWGPEDGYTNTSVRATGPYEVTTFPVQQITNGTVRTEVYNGTVHVTEGQVIGENGSASSLELTESVTERDLNTTNGGSGTNSIESPTDASEETQSIEESGALEAGLQTHTRIVG